MGFPGTLEGFLTAQGMVGTLHMMKTSASSLGYQVKLDLVTHSLARVLRTTLVILPTIGMVHAVMTAGQMGDSTVKTVMTGLHCGAPTTQQKRAHAGMQAHMAPQGKAMIGTMRSLLARHLCTHLRPLLIMAHTARGSTDFLTSLEGTHPHLHRHTPTCPHTDPPALRDLDTVLTIISGTHELEQTMGTAEC